MLFFISMRSSAAEGGRGENHLLSAAHLSAAQAKRRAEGFKSLAFQARVVQLIRLVDRRLWRCAEPVRWSRLKRDLCNLDLPFEVLGLPLYTKNQGLASKICLQIG